MPIFNKFLYSLRSQGENMNDNMQIRTIRLGLVVLISACHFKGQWFKSHSGHFIGFILCHYKIIVCVEK